LEADEEEDLEKIQHEADEWIVALEIWNEKR